MPRRVARRVLCAAVAHVGEDPRRKAAVAQIAARFPRLESRLRALVRASRGTGGTGGAIADAAALVAGGGDAGVVPATYPRSVRRVHAELMRARDGVRSRGEGVPESPP
jgi:hypothetical protein